MWRYEQATGKILHDGVKVGTGYSGYGAMKNHPEAESIPHVGPIPRGRYHIGDAFGSATKGPLCMRLTPMKGTEMYGRSAFLVHGDNRQHNASEGCIILPRPIRLMIAGSEDRELEVV